MLGSDISMCGSNCGSTNALDQRFFMDVFLTALQLLFLLK